MTTQQAICDQILEMLEGRLLIHENKLADYIKNEWPDSTLINMQKGKLAALNEVRREIIQLRYANQFEVSAADDQSYL